MGREDGAGNSRGLTPSASYAPAWSSVILGFTAGAVLDVLTFLVARDGPAADSWSLKGNGALIVPFGLGPAALAAGWSAIVAHARGLRQWLPVCIGAGIVGVALVVASVLVLVAGAGVLLSSLLTFPLLAWAIVAPILAAMIPLERRPGIAPGISHLLGAIAFPIALVAGFALTARMLAPGS